MLKTDFFSLPFIYDGNGEGIIMYYEHMYSILYFL